jgi:hypothetical protein
MDGFRHVRRTPSARPFRADFSTFSASPISTAPDRIGEFWGNPATRSFGALLIDLEEDKAARVVCP